MVQVYVKLSAPVYKSFPIKGTTGEELFKAIKAADKAAFYRANFSPGRKPEKGQLEAVKLTSDPVIFLPEWKGASKADAKLKTAWKKVLQVMSKHEEGHHKIFTRNVNALIRQLRKADTLTSDEFFQMLLKFQLEKYYDNHKYHDRRLKPDWRKIERLLKG